MVAPTKAPEKDKLPSWIKPQEDGTVLVDLFGTYKRDGIDIKQIKMRMPTVQDRLDVEAVHKDDNGKMEMMMVGNLIEFAPEELNRMAIPNYRRLARALTYFFDLGMDES